MDGGSVEIRLVYFDQGTGSFALHYDAVSDGDQRAFEVVKTDSGSFKEHVVTVTDAHFGNRGPRSCDISLLNTDAEDDIFHMVEVTFLDRR